MEVGQALNRQDFFDLLLANKIGQPNQCGATLIALVSFISKL